MADEVEDRTDLSVVSDEETQTDEDEFEGLCLPKKIWAVGLDPSITTQNLVDFFKSIAVPRGVGFEEILDENEIVVKKNALVEFETANQATLALKLKGSPLLGEPLYLGRCANGCKTIGIYGFDMNFSEHAIKEQILHQFRQCGKVLNIFLPKHPKTLALLGVGYVLLDPSGVIKLEDELDKAAMGGHYSRMWEANLKLSVYKAKMGTSQEWEPYLRKKNLLYIAELDKFLETIKPPSVEPHLTEISFSWRFDMPELIGQPGEQSAYDCWARALSKGHSAAIRLADSQKIPLTVDDLLQGVSLRHQISGKGLSSMKYAKTFMESDEHCQEMVIVSRPATDNHEDYENFEKEIISHLEAGKGGAPLVVTIDYLPSYCVFDGKGVYYADGVDFIRRAHEKLPRHVVFLTGHGFESFGGERREFWEYQESNGTSFGDGGIVKMARHQCLIKQVYVIKV